MLIPIALLLPLILAAATVAGPRSWYRRLRYGSPQPVIFLNTREGTLTATGFHQHGLRRVMDTVYQLSDVYPPCGGKPLTLLCCPHDLMPFLRTDVEDDGLLIERRRPR